MVPFKDNINSERYQIDQNEVRYSRRKPERAIRASIWHWRGIDCKKMLNLIAFDSSMKIELTRLIWGRFNTGAREHGLTGSTAQDCGAIAVRVLKP